MLALVKSISHTFSKSIISVVYWVICNWCKLTKINLSAITEIFLICTYIFNFCKIVVAINDFYKLTFKSQWKLLIIGAFTNSLFVVVKPAFFTLFGSLFAETIPT